LFTTMTTCSFANGCWFINGTCQGNFTSLKYCAELPTSLCLGYFSCGQSCYGTPNMACQGFRNEMDCGLLAGCYWNVTSCVGYVQDVQKCNRVQPAMDMCTYEGCSFMGTCTSQNCLSITNYEICIMNSECQWSLNNCVYVTTAPKMQAKILISWSLLVIFVSFLLY
jgi:hypothetical protein